MYQLQHGMGSDLQNALPPQQLDISFGGMPQFDGPAGLNSELASFINSYGAFTDTVNAQSWEQSFPGMAAPQFLQGWPSNLLTDDLQSNAVNGVETMLEYVNYDDAESSHSATHPDANYDPVQRTDDTASNPQQPSTSHDSDHHVPSSPSASESAPAHAPDPTPGPSQPYHPPSGASNAGSRRVGGTWKPPVA